ncbi:Voltage-gated potassium channel Kch [Rosistilla carotiformis]|uniref:Voltage-gated potassium channel Kch n=1 Tax=Rosistilla carotiformis TaxID=2528017 RepID=A0A518JM96_9BACT|nr:potassium channel protein [Rosistilla carotiformis]QDV66658.1 Voltage-gated potassium channel Kch [Rosistilla carotiformis]
MKTPLMRIRYGAIILVLIVALAVVGFRYLGDYDWIGAIWMVVITISTVGYGEQSNMPPELKLFTVVVILFGMSAAAYTFGGLFQLMMAGELDRAIGRQRMTYDLNKMTDHIIVCGFGRMGQNLVSELASQGRPLVVIDTDPNVIQENSTLPMICWQGDATEESTLEAVGIVRAKTLVISLPNDAESVFVTLTARNLNPDLQIIARAEKQSTGKKLRQAGATKVVMPTLVGARQMFRLITRPTTADLMERVSESAFVELDLDEFLIPEGCSLVGMTVEQTDAHRRHKLLVIAVKKTDEHLVFNPEGEYVFEPLDIIMIMGHSEDIARFRNAYGIA